MKFLLRICSVVALFFSQQLFGGYTDAYGPLQSYYTMGDYARYYSASIPYASDIYNYNKNTGNLYNAVGYLYASSGYVIDVSLTYGGPFGDYSYYVQNSASYPGAAQLYFNVHKSIIANPQASLDFDNNNNGKHTLFFPGWITPLVNQYHAALYVVFGQGISKPTSSAVADNNPALSNIPIFEPSGQSDAAYPFSTNSNNVCSYNPYVMLYTFGGGMGNLAPYGQFYGARVAHILGAITNDVPTTTGSSGATIATGSPMPQLALMKGGYTTANAPAGSVTPSTAHFGTIANFLNSLEPAVVQQYPYLQSHLLPTVTRLASLFSYEISMDEATQNLIKIKSSNENVSYDNGVIVQIQNNTGDTLQINQISSGGSITIGSLDTDQNNYFLHTASLMADGAPTSGNMIELQDLTAKSSIFIQVASSSDLKTLLSAVNSQINSLAGQTSLSLAYNQHDQTEYEQLNAVAYLVLTNFNPTALSSDEDTLLMYRVQVINIAEFFSNPYFLTLQINKEQVGVGIQPTTSATVDNPNPPTYGSAQNLFIWGGATEDTFVLYPSILSVKVCSLKNSYNTAVGSYSKMPLLLIPESIVQANITGLQVHYGIWLTAYTAALTDLSFGGAVFGDNFGYISTNFGIFESSPNPVESSRVVIDSSVLLQSGNTVNLSQPAITLMGSDVWDYGNLCVPNYYNFHQDIPVLHLYQNKQTQAIEANQAGGAYINFAVTFDSANLSSDQFGSKYGRPFENIMLFSLPTANMQEGIVGELTQTIAGDYQLLLKDQIGNVLAVGKVFDVVASPITIQFLNTNNNAAWNFSVQLPADFSSVAVGQTTKFVLKANLSTSKNSLKVLKYIPLIGLSEIQKKNYNDVAQAMQITISQSGVYDSALKDQNNMPEYFNFNIGSRAGLMFFENKWNAKLPIAPDISTILQKGSWQTGISLMLLAIDQNNNVSYLDNPSSLYLMVFDTKTGNNLEEVVIPLSALTTNFKGRFSDSSTWSDMIGIGYNGLTLSDAQYPFVFTIQKSAATVTDLSSLPCQKLIEKLQEAGLTLSEVIIADASLKDQSGHASTMPSFFNFNIGGRLGFMFFKNMWYGTQPIAPDITSILKNGSWAQGNSLFFFGIDSENNIILDLTKVDPVSFYAVIYKTTTGAYLGGITVPLTAGTRNGFGFKDSNPWSNAIDIGANGKNNGNEYPVVLTMTNKQSISIQPLIQSAQKALQAAEKIVAEKKAAKKTSDKSFAISEVISKNYKTLYEKLNKLGASIDEVQAYYPDLSASFPLPYYINFNIGSRAGLMFFENQWGSNVDSDSDNDGMGGFGSSSSSSTPAWAPIVPDITSILKAGSWANGISMILLAIDQFGHVIVDMTTVDLAPVSFYLMVYDTKTGKYLGGVAVPMASFTKNFAGFSDSNPWTNAIAIGGDSGFSSITPASGVYPFVFTLSNQQSISIQKLVGALSGQQVVAKQAAVQAAQQAAAKAAQAVELKKHKKTFYITEVQSSDYATLDEKLQKFKKSLSEVQAHDSGLQDSSAFMEGFIPATMPGYFNFDIGSRLSFAFFKNMWPAPMVQTTKTVGGYGFAPQQQETVSTPMALPLAPDLTNILGSGAWSTGMSVVLLGVDTYGNVILDLTSPDLVSFYLIAYNTTTGANLGSVAIPMSDVTQNIAKFSNKNPWSNDIAVNGSFDLIAPKKADYPVILTIYSQNKVSIKDIGKVAKAVTPVAAKVVPLTSAQLAAKAAAKKISKKSFALADVESKNYQALYEKLKTAGKSLDEIQVLNTGLYDMLIQDTTLVVPKTSKVTKIDGWPSVEVDGIVYQQAVVGSPIWYKKVARGLPYIFNINIANRVLFDFDSSRGYFSSSAITNGITNILENGVWNSGISMAFLAIDEFGNVVLDLTELDPSSFYVALYDTKTGSYLGGQAISMSDFTTNSAGVSDKNSWSNVITVPKFIVYDDSENLVKTLMNPQDGKAEYPFVVTITNKSFLSINPAQVAKTEVKSFGKTVVKSIVKTKKKNDVVTTSMPNTSAKNLQKDQIVTLSSEKKADVVPAEEPITYDSLQKVSTYADLEKQIKLMPEHQVQYPAITAQTRPLSIILGIDYIGYIFFQDFSNMAKFVAEFAADLNSKLNWANGVRFVLLGFDKASELITDPTFTKQIPLYFAVFLYDGVTGEFLGSQPLEISQMYQIPIDGMKCVVDTVQATGLYPSSFMIKSAVIKK